MRAVVMMPVERFLKAVGALALIAALNWMPAGETWAEQRSVVFEAHEYGFTGPDRLAGGVTTVQILNKGADLHHIQLVRLLEGKTAEDFVAALKADQSRFPSWIAFVGGPNAVMPGGESAATMRLAAGDHLLLCLIPDQNGVPHFAKGMVKPVTVTQGPTTTAEEPAADVTITEADFRFGLSTPISAGTRTIRVVNEGALPHEVVVVKLAPGATVKDFAAAFEPGASGPPPGQPIGGIVGMDRGGSGFFRARFEAGRYGLLCFFPDPESGAPHFAKGMALDFTVD